VVPSQDFPTSDLSSVSGKVVLSVLRALGYAVARGEAPIFITPEEVIEYIDRTGGIARWSNERQVPWIL
jgi:hypothetical protein